VNAEALASYVKERRWFRGKARIVRDVRIDETFPLDLAGAPVALSIARVTYGDDGGSERYVLVGTDDGSTHHDALTDPRLLAALLEKFRGGGTRITTDRGTLVFRPLPAFDRVEASSTAPAPSEKEQTNTSIPFGDAYILKIVRKLDEGRSAELEMGEFLTRQGYASTPPVLGAIEIERPGTKEASSIGIIHRFVPNRGDAWSFTLEILEKSTSPDAYAAHAALLGKRVAEMHAVLAKGTGAPFVPEHLDRDKRDKLAAALRDAVRRVQKHLREGDEARIEAKLAEFVALEEDPIATRVHGDLHLGQILATPPPTDDFILIDFEGEPARPIDERKAKRSPMADVAGMLRSFDYAAATAKAPRAWYRGAADAFLRGYGEVPRDVLSFYLLEKCIYEIAYEANNRPDWIGIPLEGLKELVA
jgi:trehalose synthase-fused probable maltokinase